MSVKFNVQSAFNFSADSYGVVFNTSGSGVTPLPVAQTTNWAGYSIAIVVGGAGGAISPFAYYYYRPNNTSQAPVLYPIGATPQQLILQPNSNGQGTQFTVIFQTIIASFNVTTSPTPSPTASPTASPTPTPTASSSASPSPGPTASGVGVSNLWNFNFFVVQGVVSQYESQGTLQIIDSLGAGGPNDTTYISPQLDISTPFDTGAFYVQAGTHPSIPDSIASGDIANNPAI
ncbi:MAG: hypothetical protein WBD74_02200 [Candidatus Aquilonibacter sp.]